MSKLLNGISKLFSRKSEDIDPKEWHAVRFLWWSKRMESGQSTNTNSSNPVYRRLKADGKWEYKQEPEHDDEYYHRQW